MRKYKIQLILFLIACNFTTFGQKKASSALSSGDIYKFAVENNGLYRITYDFLNSIEDININSINPQNLNIYSSGGGIVPQILSESRIDDLEAVPILFSGENDGSFDPGDYLIVYMEGADKFHVSNSEIKFEKNVYNTKNYFYLKLNDSQPVRVESQPSLSNTDLISNSTETIIDTNKIDLIYWGVLVALKVLENNGLEKFLQMKHNNHLTVSLKSLIL